MNNALKAVSKGIDFPSLGSSQRYNLRQEGGCRRFLSKVIPRNRGGLYGKRERSKKIFFFKLAVDSRAQAQRISGESFQRSSHGKGAAEISNQETKHHTQRVGELRLITPAGPEELTLQALSPEQRGYRVFIPGQA